MDAPLRKPWTLDEFFTWASRQEGRHEFDGLQPIATAGGSAWHAAIATDTKLRGSGCRPLGSDADLETGDSVVRYPDALVTCSKFDLQGREIP